METKRICVESLEKIIGQETKILDKGFIRVIDYMGDDAAIVQAARISYGKGTKSVSNDKSLIKYLLRNEHTSVFEMCEIKLHIKAPIFVARQWLRHRTANVNEYSARYSEMESDFYLPEMNHITGQNMSNKQARGGHIDQSIQKKSQEKINQINEDSYKAYQELIEDEVAREVARGVLPTNLYTQFYWKIDLNNLLRFIKLRSSSHAQFEIREYAIAIKNILKAWVPFTYEAFDNYNQISLSKDGIKIVQALSNNENINQEDTNMSKNEWNELMKNIKREDLLK
ncbi:FAD-dependent thymidylate synthase [Candidatus Cytomitobacter indipagum]|uniref:Flavin-dependent thymidylate synthase n=1 Tax=Candidatus Cytomitobacter indipagum TaxID=2601575 RepID=A0A5C0UDT6_9PROT|nr:FAD-dependent thymidylate synthase [Candidatus Cytomitobacter indipagum]QEK37850.1 FAD-dependent thymidylate synthase [Candidatus Cytomitobacter indipagum]